MEYALPSCYNFAVMDFKAEHAGKWVAVKDGKVISTDASFSSLRKRLRGRKDQEKISFDLIPRGFVTGGF